jgi:hypothetical protein
MKNTSTTRRSLESFKATAAATSIKGQIQMITGGALSGCHTPVVRAAA